MKFPGTGGRGKGEKPSEPVELPERSADVTLVPPGGARIPARVLGSEQGMLLVAIMVPSEPLSPRQLDALVLEFNDAQGRSHLVGTASIEDPSDPDVLRIVDPRSLDVVQEREYVRIKSARPAIVFGGPDLAQINSYTIDISGGGFLLAADMLKVGDQVHFQIDLTAGERPISGTGKVVRIDARGRRGVVFDDIKDLDRRRLIRYIFECQRAELRLGLEADHHGE